MSETRPQTFLGIDPGFTGAYAVLEPSGAVFVTDLPVMKVGHKLWYDLPALRDGLRYWAGKALGLYAAVELVHAFPGQGVVSMWRMGYSTGVLEGLLTACEIPFERVSPQRWQQVMLDGFPKGTQGKDVSRYRAQALFPTASLGRQKDHGRADALLIAEWMRRQWVGH